MDVFDGFALLSGDAGEGVGEEFGERGLAGADGAADGGVLGAVAEEWFEELGEAFELVGAVGEVCGYVVEVEGTEVLEDGVGGEFVLDDAHMGGGKGVWG